MASSVLTHTIEVFVVPVMSGGVGGCDEGLIIPRTVQNVDIVLCLKPMQYYIDTHTLTQGQYYHY